MKVQNPDCVLLPCSQCCTSLRSFHAHEQPFSTYTRTYIQFTQTNKHTRTRIHTHTHAHLHTIHTHSKCKCSIFPIILYFGFGRIMIGMLWIGCGWGWWGLNSLRALRTNLTKYGCPVHASCDLFDMLDQAPISGISSPISFKMVARKRWQRRDKQRTHKSREIKLFDGDVSFLQVTNMSSYTSRFVKRPFQILKQMIIHKRKRAQ